MGAKVILSARNEQKLEEVKSGLAHPEDARCVQNLFDLSIESGSRQ